MCSDWCADWGFECPRQSYNPVPLNGVSQNRSACVNSDSEGDEDDVVIFEVMQESFGGFATPTLLGVASIPVRKLLVGRSEASRTDGDSRRLRLRGGPDTEA